MKDAKFSAPIKTKVYARYFMMLGAVNDQLSDVGHEARRLEQERDAALRRMVIMHRSSDNTKHPLQQSSTGRHFQPRQGRNRCRNRPPMILSPVRGDIIRTMPLLRSLGFHCGRGSTKMPRLRRCHLMTQRPGS